MAQKIVSVDRKQDFVQEVADCLYRIYGIHQLIPAAKVMIEAYYDRNLFDYDALAYGARDCRLSRFLHNRIVPVNRSPSRKRRGLTNA